MTETLWELAHQKIDRIVGANVGLNGKAIKDSHTVLKMLRNFNILPSRIIYNIDNEISINFHRSIFDYQIDIGSDSTVLMIDKKHSFYRRDSEGNVTSDASIDEFTDLNELKEAVSMIVPDTYDDFLRLLDSIEKFNENWHVNYYKSKKISQAILQNCRKLLERLNKSNVLLMLLTPIVLDMDGNVAVRVIYQFGESNFLVDIKDENATEFCWGEYLQERNIVSQFPFDRFMLLFDVEVSYE